MEHGIAENGSASFCRNAERVPIDHRYPFHSRESSPKPAYIIEFAATYGPSKSDYSPVNPSDVPLGGPQINKKQIQTTVKISQHLLSHYMRMKSQHQEMKFCQNVPKVARSMIIKK